MGFALHLSSTAHQAFLFALHLMELLRKPRHAQQEKRGKSGLSPQLHVHTGLQREPQLNCPSEKITDPEEEKNPTTTFLYFSQIYILPCVISEFFLHIL